MKFLFIFISVSVERNRASGHLVIKMKKFKEDLYDNPRIIPKSNDKNQKNNTKSSNGKIYLHLDYNIVFSVKLIEEKSTLNYFLLKQIRLKI